ncbi:hypothetical protein FRC19_009810 [Serendipita sp. 401]|nr:hypothetical protein FRC19_009810 [Serendipita sp. 401]KAG9052857.1 hypothetical protein FS842_009147 [Serendipita sp. 407]
MSLPTRSVHEMNEVPIQDNRRHRPTCRWWLTVDVEQNKDARLKELYRHAMGVSALLTAIVVAVFIHVREQLSLLEGRKEAALDPDSSLANSLLIIAYIAVLSNGGASIMSYILLGRLNAGTSVLEDQHHLDSTGPSQTAGAVRQVILKIMAKTAGMKLHTWFSQNREGLAKAYWLLNLLIGFMSPFLEFALYAFVFEIHLLLKGVVLLFSTMAMIPLVVFWKEIFRAIHL